MKKYILYMVITFALFAFLFSSCTKKEVSNTKKLKATTKQKVKDSRISQASYSNQDKAPDFALQNILTGEILSLSDFRGKVIILDFWATWCPPCKAEIPNFVSLYHKYKDKGFIVIGVALDRGGKADILPFVRDRNVDYPILFGDVKRLYEITNLYGGINAIPTTFIIDRNMNIVEKVVGYRPKEYFEQKITELLNK